MITRDTENTRLGDGRDSERSRAFEVYQISMTELASA